MLEPQWWNVGTMIGAAFSAFWAGRAAKNTSDIRRQTAVAQTELIGPDNEPSLRMLIQDAQRNLKDHREEVGALFRGLHSDFEGLNSRMESLSARMGKLEATVFESLESRLKKVEQETRESNTLSAAVASISKLLNAISDRMDRAQENIHRIAQAMQIKLLSPEEVERKLQR